MLSFRNEGLRKVKSDNSKLKEFNPNNWLPFVHKQFEMLKTNWELIIYYIMTK